MGGGQSVSQKQKTDILNKIISDVMVDQSIRCDGTIVNRVLIKAVGGAKITGIDIQQASKISLICLQTTKVNAAMQADIVSKIMNEAKQKSSLGIQLTRARNDSDIENKIRNIVSSRLNINNMASLSTSIENTARVIAEGKGSDIKDQRVVQVAEGLGSIVNDTSADIVQYLDSFSDAKNKSDTTTTNAFVDFLKTAWEGLNNFMKSIFQLSPQLVIMVIACVFIATAIGGLVYVLRPKEANDLMKSSDMKPADAPSTPIMPNKQPDLPQTPGLNPEALGTASEPYDYFLPPPTNEALGSAPVPDVSRSQLSASVVPASVVPAPPESDMVPPDA